MAKINNLITKWENCLRFNCIMQNADAPFQALYNDIDDNYWWQQAGNLRPQIVADARFRKYVEDDPAEASRIKLQDIEGSDGKIYYYQIVYPEASSPNSFITWYKLYRRKNKISQRHRAS